MRLTSKRGASLQTRSRSLALPRPTLLRPCAATSRVSAKATQQDDATAQGAGRRDFLGLLGLLLGVSTARAAQAADPYEELKALSEARTGSGSLLESFQGTKAAVSGGKASRGIREKLAAEAAPAKSGGLFGSSGPKSSGSSGSSSGLRPAKTPAVAASKPKPSLSFSAPKPPAAAPAPKTPKPAATAAGSSAGGGIFSGPLVQAVGVLGLVGVGASAATSAATSKPKDKPAPAQAASRSATPAPAAARQGTDKVKTAAAAAAAASAAKSATGKVAVSRPATPAAKPATGKVAVSRPSTPAAKSATGKVAVSRPATPVAKSATGKVAVSRPATPAAVKSATGKVKKGAAAVAASGSTVKTAVKKALVNEEAPDQPTDFATGGFLGFVALLGAFLLFGQPQPQVVTPTSSAPSDPLVEEARKRAAGVVTPGYTTPLFKPAEDQAARSSSSSKAFVAPAAPKAPAVVPVPVPAPVAPKIAAPAPAAPKPAVEAPKPAAAVKAVETPKPAAPTPAPAVKAEAPKPAAPAPAAPKPAAPVAPKVQAPAAVKAPAKPEAPKPAAAKPSASSSSSDSSAPSAAQNLLVVAGGIAVVVTAFALTGSSSSEGGSSGGEAAAGGATSTPATAGAGEGGAAAASAAAAVSAAAESVSAAASAAAATAAPPADAAQGGQEGNAAYDKAVLALMADPEVTEDLFSVMTSGDASLRNIPALAWALISTPSNAEKLDGFAFQKLSKPRYERVRQVLLDAGLPLPDTPKLQPGAAASLAPVGAVDSSDVDPDKLRGVFEALLANPASRTLMRQLLKGAGMPFNEEAFEEQVKDSNYFNLAIAPILRSMPQQKLKVLAELQDPEKLQQLVASVSTLAQDAQQLESVTAELSSDVRQTVDTIREAEQRAAGSSSSR